MRGSNIVASQIMTMPAVNYLLANSSHLDRLDRAAGRPNIIVGLMLVGDQFQTKPGIPRLSPDVLSPKNALWQSYAQPRQESSLGSLNVDMQLVNLDVSNITCIVEW